MFDHRVDTDALLEVRKRFELYFAARNPAPQPSTSWFVVFSLAVLVLASVIVSCSHTIPAFLATIEGETPDAIKVIVAIAAFLMVEASLLVFAYTNTSWQARNDEQADETAASHVSHSGVQSRLKFGLYSVLILAIGANLYSTLLPRFGEADWWDLFSFFVFIAVGASAPALAYIAGEVTAITMLLNQRETASVLSVWKEKREAEWDAVLERYNRSQLRAGRPTADRQTDQNRQTDQTDTADKPTEYQTFEQALKARQTPPEQTTAPLPVPAEQTTERGEKHNRMVVFYMENPDQIKRDPRQVAKENQVGKDTAYKARDEAMRKLERARLDNQNRLQ
jgi:hypothetical protein